MKKLFLDRFIAGNGATNSRLCHHGFQAILFPNISINFFLDFELVHRKVVVENVFHFKQILSLQLGENRIGRYVQGTSINQPIETVDPSIDTLHCIIQVKQDKNGKLQYILRDGPSGTGTFYMNSILGNNERVTLQDGDIITIGATTLIMRCAEED